MEESDYTLSELSDKSGVPVRTIRYYINKHLLPRPTGKGPSSRYGFVHLAKLAVIRRLQDEGASLDTIALVLEELDEGEIAAAAVPVRNLLASMPNAQRSQASLAQDYAEMVRTRARASGVHASISEPPVLGPRHSYDSAARRFGQRSHWEHITLTPSIELTVRRPLPASQRRALEQLLEAAKRLFGEPPEEGGD